MIYVPYSVRVGAAAAVSGYGFCWVVCHFLPSSWKRYLEYIQGAGDSSTTLRRGHRSIFNVLLMRAEVTPSATSISDTTHTDTPTLPVKHQDSNSSWMAQRRVGASLGYSVRPPAPSKALKLILPTTCAQLKSSIASQN